MPCLHCESLLEASMPPDEELVDLIEWAFLEGQIDGAESDLAYLLLASLSRNAGTFVGTNAN
jgi:hypothetical protein